MFLDCFSEDIMTDVPDKYVQFADYVLAGYITDSSIFPPTMWAAFPDLTSKIAYSGNKKNVIQGQRPDMENRQTQQRTQSN